ncbi:MAG: metal-dependent phosphohydrolase [Capsulimonadaceae bacterium]
MEVDHLCMTELVIRWRLAIHRARGRIEGSVADDCLSYFVKHIGAERPYHNASHTLHVTTLSSALIQIDTTERQDTSLALAALYHDITYDPQAIDNEDQSATLAGSMLVQVGAAADVIPEVHRLILLTRHTEMCAPSDVAGQAICDADLAILGTDWQTYDSYRKAIRVEYAHIPTHKYVAGRTAVLHRFLERPSVYQLPSMRAYEELARRNIAWEIDDMATRGVD